MVSNFSIPTTGFSAVIGSNSIVIHASDLLSEAPSNVSYILSSFTFHFTTATLTDVVDLQSVTFDLLANPFPGIIYNISGGNNRVSITDTPIAPVIVNSASSTVIAQLNFNSVAAGTFYYSFDALLTSSTPSLPSID